ncbi:50S ribosomal protein L23 [Candidatus Collierbacteria bacterium RIFCSPLOWO2_01_FULL_50_23]|uniref:Large ribosomal subunit protein uL23 n=2 Tax=Candidatus Collieribacteriota TaxID=1752725 RepID=A0A1F5EV17_9BACT|nr:MAG: 50S ribosomal protein L23 [Candidatus Collierbacteria bacterium RIFCSPHIGHO2_02_FULL_49_10]OGD71666.1 MAG: 50S ribosomal protein L23 [Candidatus Collierbacteria bacterium RIFCSPHIGHO2_01_FULL_50_25]OGD73978.1 MAG: 50S ribosomal protein L23 [Candidatus Collierbacteria bacterium RIFCSPLOWO2_01_FULL_50_23]
MITKPVFTEKSYAATALDRFTFKVDRHATKNQIKNEVEKLYGVKVVAINTTLVKSRISRSGKTGKKTTEKGFKKAIIKLKSGQKIKLFNI